ncbi:MAG: phytanoyl-CoA dioxygenase family protein, partial [Alphaproteobacteria bacterium]
MTVPRLTTRDSADDVEAALAEAGCAVVERVLSDEVRARVLAELDPWMRATPVGPDDFAGRRTRRTGGLVARSPASREVVLHPLVLDVVRKVLSHAAGFQLHLT